MRQSGGGIPERPNGPDCKSGGEAFAGSNPASPTFLLVSLGFIQAGFEATEAHFGEVWFMDVAELFTNSVGLMDWSA